MLLCTLAEIQTVCQVRVWDGRRGRKQGEGGDLLVTITIKLLYKTPVDNIGGITEQERKSSFIKKALLLVEGDKGDIQAGSPSLSSLSGGGRWVQSVSPAASLGFINLCIYFLHVSCADVGTHSWKHMNMQAS